MRSPGIRNAGNLVKRVSLVKDLHHLVALLACSFVLTLPLPPRLTVIASALLVFWPLVLLV